MVIFDRQSTGNVLYTPTGIVHATLIVHTRRVLCTSLQVRARPAAYRATTLDQSRTGDGRAILNCAVSALALAYLL
jgi:hypothetical protein